MVSETMDFKIGIIGLLKFKTTLAAVKRGDYAGVARGMLDTLWGSQMSARNKWMAELMCAG